MDGKTGVLIAAGALILIIIIAVVVQTMEDSSAAAGAPNSQLAKETCEKAGGHWNDCSPACRDLKPDQSCAKECTQECECAGFAGWSCPEGFKCGEYFPNKETPDATGICKKQ